MIIESEIREKLAAVTSNSITLEEFEDWVVSTSWNMHRDSTPEAIDLAAEIELEFAEYTSCHQSEAELMGTLKKISEREHEKGV